MIALIMKLLDAVIAALGQLTRYQEKQDAKQTPEAKANADIQKASDALVDNRIDDLNIMFDRVREHEAPSNDLVK